jgi:hypothetical protein
MEGKGNIIKLLPFNERKKGVPTMVEQVQSSVGCERLYVCFGGKM